MIVSSVPAAKAYLLNAIQAQVNTDPLSANMLVKLGAPAKYLPPDAIIIGEVHRTVNPATFIGSGNQFWLNEDYEITIEIASWVKVGDADVNSTAALAVDARAWQLVAYVETAVRLDPSLGGLVDEAYPKESVTLGPEWTPDGLIVNVTVPISVSKLN